MRTCDNTCKNNADPGCSGISGFPVTQFLDVRIHISTYSTEKVIFWLGNSLASLKFHAKNCLDTDCLVHINLSDLRVGLSLHISS